MELLKQINDSNLYGSVGFYEKYYMAISFGAAVVLIAISMLIAILIHKKVILKAMNKKYGDNLSEEVKEKKESRSITYSIILFFVILFGLGYLVGVQILEKPEDKREAYMELKRDFLEEAVHTYIEVDVIGASNMNYIYIGDTLINKNKSIAIGNLYRETFTLNDELYRDKIIYVTYDDALPSGVMLSFDKRDEYYKMIANKENAVTSYQIGYNRKDKVEINEIDFIYNLKIN